MQQQMTGEERAAAAAFHADLVDQFNVNSKIMWEAKGDANIDRYNECVETTRVLYREIKEVEFCLRTGVLPAEDSTPFGVMV